MFSLGVSHSYAWSEDETVGNGGKEAEKVEGLNWEMEDIT